MSPCSTTWEVHNFIREQKTFAWSRLCTVSLLQLVHQLSIISSVLTIQSSRWTHQVGGFPSVLNSVPSTLQVERAVLRHSSPLQAHDTHLTARLHRQATPAEGQMTLSLCHGSWPEPCPLWCFPLQRLLPQGRAWWLAAKNRYFLEHFSWIPLMSN